jgi:hypothetical protein
MKLISSCAMQQWQMKIERKYGIKTNAYEIMADENQECSRKFLK